MRKVARNVPGQAAAYAAGKIPVVGSLAKPVGTKAAKASIKYRRDSRTKSYRESALKSEEVARKRLKANTKSLKGDEGPLRVTTEL